jgi:hypothetical protein
MREKQEVASYELATSCSGMGADFHNIRIPGTKVSGSDYWR